MAILPYQLPLVDHSTILATEKIIIVSLTVFSQWFWFTLLFIYIFYM